MKNRARIVDFSFLAMSAFLNSMGKCPFPSPRRRPFPFLSLKKAIIPVPPFRGFPSQDRNRLEAEGFLRYNVLLEEYEFFNFSSTHCLFSLALVSAVSSLSL